MGGRGEGESARERVGERVRECVRECDLLCGSFVWVVGESEFVAIHLRAAQRSHVNGYMSTVTCRGDM